MASLPTSPLARVRTRRLRQRGWGLLLLPLLAVAALLGGCDEDFAELRALDAETLSERAACDDITVVAASPDASEALLLGVDDGLVAEALAEQRVVHADYELPDDRLTVRLVEGSSVVQGHCGYQQLAEPWKVDRRHDAETGHVALRIEPHADGRVEVTAEFEGMLLESELDPPVVVEDLRLERLPLKD